MTMKNAKNDLAEIVDELVALTEAANKMYGIKPARPVPAGPASSGDLEALENHLSRRRLPFPPSYRALLEIHDGIRAFSGKLDLRSSKEVIQPPSRGMTLDFPTLSQFVISSGNTPNFISFDPETAKPNGEMEVVWAMADGGQFRYSDFGMLLRALRDELRKTVAQEQADRKNLRD
jgi:hypothetical protein